MAKPVSQSRTMWVKKGTVVNGETIKKGYVAQYGRPEKRVTNRVRLEVDTPKRGVKGDVVTLKKGRYVQPSSTTSTGSSTGSGRGTGSGGGNGGGNGSGGGSTTKTTRVSPSARGEGGRVFDRKATSGTVTSAVVQGKRGGAGSGAGVAPYKKGEGLKGVQRTASGFVRGTGAAGRKGTTVGRGSEAARLKAKRAEDTRNQVRNAVAAGALMAAPVALASSGGVSALTSAGRAIAGGAGRAAGMAGRGAGGLRGVAGKAADRRLKSAIANYKGKAPAPRASAVKETTGKLAGETTRNVSKRTGGIVKNGKPVRLGPNRPTAKQMDQAKRGKAAWKGQQTRKANASKKTTKKK